MLDDIKRPRDLITARAFGVALERLREKCGISQQRLYELTGVDRTYLSALANGKHDPSIGTIVLLAPHLEVTPVQFMRLVMREREKLAPPEA